MAAVVGSFETCHLARRAVEDLLAAWFEPDVVSIVGPDHGPGAAAPDDDTAPSVATGPAADGGGGLAALLAGVAALTTPDAGPILALGPLASALSPAFGGGPVGGLVGVLMSEGLSREQADLYVERVRGGGSLVAVRCEPRDEVRAATILAAAGAEAPIRTG